MSALSEMAGSDRELKLRPGDYKPKIPSNYQKDALVAGNALVESREGSKKKLDDRFNV